MGHLRTFSEWDHVRAKDVDERYNLIGHGWALLISRIEYSAIRIVGRRSSFDTTTPGIRTDALVDRYFCKQKTAVDSPPASVISISINVPFSFPATF